MSYKHTLIQALELTEKELAVLKVLESLQFGRNVAWISRKAGVPRTTGYYILKKLEKWKFTRKGKTIQRISTTGKVRGGKQTVWRYNKLMDIWGKEAPKTPLIKDCILIARTADLDRPLTQC